MNRSTLRLGLLVTMLVLAFAAPPVEADPVGGHGGCTPACIEVEYCAPPMHVCLKAVDINDDSIWGEASDSEPPVKRFGVPGGDGSSCAAPDCVHVYREEGDCASTGCLRVHVHVHVHVALL